MMIVAFYLEEGGGKWGGEEGIGPSHLCSMHPCTLSSSHITLCLTDCPVTVDCGEGIP